MRSLTVRSAFAAIAIAAAALGSAATAVAVPAGPCENVTYVGVCEPLREQPNSPSQQGMGEVVISGGNNSIQTVG